MPSPRPAATAIADHQPRSSRPSLVWNRSHNLLKPASWAPSLGHQSTATPPLPAKEVGPPPRTPARFISQSDLFASINQKLWLLTQEPGSPLM
jgi:hypothetical protein